jgi:hypothetical protein
MDYFNQKCFVNFQIDLMDSLSLELNFKLDKEPAKYGVRKTMLKTAFISAGRKDYIANIFTGFANKIR